MNTPLCESDELLLSRIEDAVRAVACHHAPKYIGFLDERQHVLVSEFLRTIKAENTCFRGGYPDARRVYLCVYPDWMDADEGDDPVCACRFVFRAQDTLTHRDVLGALMALGIRRETLGDILVAEGVAVVFCTETVQKLIVSDVQKIGRVGVKILPEAGDLSVFEQKFEPLSGTVSSLRLDCVVAFVTNLSREKTLALIRAKYVKLNHFEVTEPDCGLQQGDVLSIRGYGRFMLEETGGPTKKGRLRITMNHYL